MSLLPNNTYANPDNSFYALAGSGGGSTLQSPVNVLPSAPGSISISGIAGVGGSAELSLLAGAAQPANILIGQNLGETYLIEANPSQLTIGAGALTVGQTPVFQYTQTTGAVNLGDNTAGGGITTNSPQLYKVLLREEPSPLVPLRSSRLRLHYKLRTMGRMAPC